MITQQVMAQFEQVMLWGLVATALLTTVLYGSQGLGLSRLSLPFLFGTFFTADRSRAGVLGFTLYLLGGWLFALLYMALFVAIGESGPWRGALFGLIHGVFILVVFLPLLPYVHPRMATEYDGPTARRRLEPPGFLGLNYGRRTPLTTLLGHTLYGLLLGYGYHIG